MALPEVDFFCSGRFIVAASYELWNAYRVVLRNKSGQYVRYLIRPYFRDRLVHRGRFRC